MTSHMCSESVATSMASINTGAILPFARVSFLALLDVYLMNMGYQSVHSTAISLLTVPPFANGDLFEVIVFLDVGGPRGR